jgi:hypothetical protein
MSSCSLGGVHKTCEKRKKNCKIIQASQLTAWDCKQPEPLGRLTKPLFNYSIIQFTLSEGAVTKYPPKK